MRRGPDGVCSRRPLARSNPLAPSSAPGTSSSASRRWRSNGPGMRQRGGLLRGKAEAAVIGRIADQDDGAVAELARLAQRAADQRGADAALAADRPRPPPGRAARPADPSPQATFHSRAVPMTRLPSAATKESPSAGSRPSRRRCEALRLRLSPKASSSSASRALTSFGRSWRNVIISGSFPAPSRAQARGRAQSARGEGKGRRRTASRRGVRCGRSSAARSR